MNHLTVLRPPHDGRRFTNVVLLLTGQTLSLFGSSVVQYAWSCGRTPAWS